MNTDHTAAEQLNALLEHFRRSGIPFLPTADAAKVEQWAKSNPPVQRSAVVMAVDPVVAKIAATRPAVVPRLVAPSRLDPVTSPHPSLVAVEEPYAGATLTQAERTSALAEISREIAACLRCPALASSRKSTVPGEGNAMARVCFIGDAPGADEDASGRPFADRAGQLLTKMIEACTFTRDDVFIMNMIRCRPPNDRPPAFEEMEHCRGYLQRQLDIIQPQYIVCLGLMAAQTILNSKLSIGRLRNQFHAYRGSKVLVTYPPSYLLREPEVKKAAWADLQFLLRDMGIELPKR